MCNCTKKGRFRYVWTSVDGKSTVTYTTEIAADAKVKRKGGSYQKVPV